MLNMGLPLQNSPVAGCGGRNSWGSRFHAKTNPGCSWPSPQTT